MLTLSRKIGRSIIITPPPPGPILEMIEAYVACDVTTPEGLHRAGEIKAEIKERLKLAAGRITVLVKDIELGKVRLSTSAPSGTMINRDEVQKEIDATGEGEPS